jgi:hypothetical protein
MLVGGAEGRDVRFRENEQRSQASDLGAKPPVSSGAERPVLGSPDEWWSRRRGSIAAKLDWVSTLGALRLDDRGSTQMQLALIPSFAGKAIHHPSDACRHARVRLGAFFLVFAHDPTRQGDPSTVDANLDAVARNGEIPIQRRHDGELDALVTSPLPIAVVVCPKLELRGDLGWVANRNDGLAWSFVRIFPRNALQLYLPYLSDFGYFPLLTTQRLTLGSLQAALEIGSQA